MQDKELYQAILGNTTPWHVAEVRLDATAQTIEIEMALNDEKERWVCPTCGAAMHGHGRERRTWRHLDSCQFKTIVVADVPRVRCLIHETQMVQVPWASPRGRFTAMFERFAIDVMLSCATSKACELLRISWDEADGIKQRAVDRGLGRRKDEPVRRVCVDEKAVGVGQTYVTIVSSLDAGRARVLYIGDDIQDLPVLRAAGVAVAVSNARPEVRAAAHWVTRRPGGEGAVREVAEAVLKSQGLWRAVLERFR